MDFLADLMEIAKGGLDHYDVDYSDLSNDRDIVERFTSVQLKLVQPVPRAVKKSSKILSRSLLPNARLALNLIETNCVAGHDINPYLSRKIFFPPDSTDYLLADWGIYHLHLSHTFDSKGKYFMARSDYLLFAVFTESEAYFIDIRPHKETYVFAQKELLKMLHVEWPHILRPYRLSGVIGLEREIDDADEIHALRKAGVTVLQKVGDAVYAPKGGGITTGKTPLRVTQAVIGLYNRIKNAMAYFEANKDSIAAHIAQATGPTVAAPDFHLALQEEGFCIVDRQSGRCFPFP
jgi:hypothetical protein